MDTAELFAGTKSFSKVAAALGHSTLTFELEPRFEPDHVVDILEMPVETVPYGVDVLWASPPCQGFSVAAIGKNWTGGHRGYIPKSDSARLSIALAKKTLAIIEARKPTWWFIENPRGLMRKMPFIEGLTRHTVTYCQYGDTRMKPTDIWTNATWWTPKPVCHNGDPCHDAAPRGSRTGTQGLKGDEERSRIPPLLFAEIFAQMPAELRRAA